MGKNIYALVGDRVRAERRRLRLTLEQLAELSGLSPSFIAYIETKGRKASLLYDSARRFALLVRDREPDERDVLLDMVKAVSAKFAKMKPSRAARSSRA